MSYTFSTIADKQPTEVGFLQALGASFAFMRANALRWLPVALACIAVTIALTAFGGASVSRMDLFLAALLPIGFAVYYLRLAVAGRTGGAPGTLLGRAAVYLLIGLNVALLITGLVILMLIPIGIIFSQFANAVPGVLSDISTQLANPDQLAAINTTAVSGIAEALGGQLGGLLGLLLIVLLIAAPVLMIFFVLRLSQAPLAAIVLGDGVFASLRRSWRISRGSLWRIFVWGLLTNLLLFGINQFFVGVPVELLAGEAGLTEESALEVSALGGMVVSYLTAPLSLGVLLVLFERLAAVDAARTSAGEPAASKE